MSETKENKHKSNGERYRDFYLLCKATNDLFIELRDMWTGKFPVDSSRLKTGEKKSREIEEIFRQISGDSTLFEKPVTIESICFNRDGSFSENDHLLRQLYITKTGLDGIIRRIKKSA
jgi:hypothetical protein